MLQYEQLIRFSPFPTLGHHRIGAFNYYFQSFGKTCIYFLHEFLEYTSMGAGVFYIVLNDVLMNHFVHQHTVKIARIEIVDIVINHQAVFDDCLEILSYCFPMKKAIIGLTLFPDYNSDWSES